MIQYHGRDYILPSKAAKWAGLKNGAIYKAIRKRKLPAIVEVVCGQKFIKIPTESFKLWLDIEIKRFEKKLEHLKKSRNELERYSNG